MMRIIKIILIVACAAALCYVSAVKINNIVLKDFEVINLKKLYAEKGTPVYTMNLVEKKAVFVKNMTLVHESGLTYSAFISRDLKSQINYSSIVYVPKDSSLLKQGFNSADKDKYYIGKITSISNSADWQTGFYKVLVQMNTKLPALTFYSAKVVIAERNKSLVVPISVLENIGGKYYAWICSPDSHAKRVVIKTGVCDGYNCEILGGAKKGDILVTSDLKLLEPDLLLNNVGENK